MTTHTSQLGFFVTADSSIGNGGSAGVRSHSARSQAYRGVQNGKPILTPRQEAVLQLTRLGFDDAKLARAIGVADRSTVRHIRRRARARLAPVLREMRARGFDTQQVEKLVCLN